MRLRDAAGRIIYVGVSTPQRVMRIAGEQLGQTTVILVDRGLDWHYIEMAVQHVVDSELLERTIVRALDRLDMERVLASPAAERIAAQVVESRVVRDAIARVVEDTVERLRDSPAMWNLIEEVMQSPAVADAITQQGMGFADQVGDEVRERSRTVDDKLEHAAWRLLRRRPRPVAESP